MTSIKCSTCGLINFADAALCRRCGTSLVLIAGDDQPSPRRTFANRILWILGMVLTILVICYSSLRLTSDTPNFDQRQEIAKAISIIEARGFSKESFILGNLTSFRTTDNWWNTQTGHRQAYAATNFPFELVTLYPEFFDVATDDTERAAILLHEAQHLMGSGEIDALDATWREKQKLGWTADRYSDTKVWKNTKELTQFNLPQLFRCGSDLRSDCF